MRESPTATALISAGRGEVCLQQRRRAALSIGDVVETKRGTVGRQERGDVNVEGEQVADRVGVFGAIQAAQRGPARIAGAALVEFPFEPGDKRVGRGRFGPTHPARRHRADAQSAYDLFPGLGIAAHVGDIQLIDRQATRLQPRVVTGHAVLLQRGLMCRGTRHRSRASDGLLRARARVRAHQSSAQRDECKELPSHSRKYARQPY